MMSILVVEIIGKREWNWMTEQDVLSLVRGLGANSLSKYMVSQGNLISTSCDI